MFNVKSLDYAKIIVCYCDFYSKGKIYWNWSIGICFFQKRRRVNEHSRIAETERFGHPLIFAVAHPTALNTNTEFFNSPPPE